MKVILLLFVWILLPIAFIVVAFDVAKASVEDKILTILKEKTHD